MIKLENLTKQFVQKKGQPLKAVDNVNLNVPEGEMCVLLGPSGCGKTTTLKMINRLIAPSSGNILINDENTNDMDTVTLRRNIGYVIQQIGLFPNMTIEENITVVPRMLGWDKARCKQRAEELMEMVALDARKFLHRYPKEMSGGQQQRIGVIRALAADPPVLLMDEPFGAVDPINREVIQNQFLDMQRKLKKTVMLVSHDIDEALKLGDRIAVFRQGRIVQCASPDELLAKPANEFVGSFVGQDRTLKRLFVKRREARNASGTCADITHPFRITGKAEDNLRIVLSRLYESNTSWMPIVDEDGRYNGEISQDYIADYLSSGRTRRALNIHESS
ncbi:ABC transporter ATP-binding protein [Salmonella enterica]|nr:ABC transporter ATP-binding protein [Salmonella enterica]